MEETISVRISKEELRKIEEILKYEKSPRSHILREVLEKGIKEKRLEIALEMFQNNEATAWKAARLAGIPLIKFLDILKEKGLEFHYTEEELLEDFEEDDF